MYVFGTGFAYLIPSATVGNPATNPTPMRFGTIQDASVEIAQELKDLYGNLKFPDDVAPGKMKISGKVKFGRIEIDVFNQAFFGETGANAPTLGNTVDVDDEGPTAIPVTPFTITVTHSANFAEDHGVINSSTGQSFIAVASSPVAGQYSVSAGVYTFAAADNVSAISVKISYAWTNASAGRTLTVINHVMGYGPVCKLVLSKPYQGANGLTLNQVRFSKISSAVKNDDYEIPEMDFQSFPDSSGVIGKFFQVSP